MRNTHLEIFLLNVDAKLLPGIEFLEATYTRIAYLRETANPSNLDCTVDALYAGHIGATLWASCAIKRALSAKGYLLTPSKVEGGPMQVKTPDGSTLEFRGGCLERYLKAANYVCAVQYAERTPTITVGKTNPIPSSIGKYPATPFTVMAGWDLAEKADARKAEDAKLAFIYAQVKKEVEAIYGIEDSPAQYKPKLPATNIMLWDALMGGHWYVHKSQNSKPKYSIEELVVVKPASDSERAVWKVVRGVWHSSVHKEWMYLVGDKEKIDSALVSVRESQILL
jgi:hypothetical protein